MVHLFLENIILLLKQMKDIFSVVNEQFITFSVFIPMNVSVDIVHLSSIVDVHLICCKHILIDTNSLNGQTNEFLSIENCFYLSKPFKRHMRFIEMPQLHCKKSVSVEMRFTQRLKMRGYFELIEKFHIPWHHNSKNKYSQRIQHQTSRET